MRRSVALQVLILGAVLLFGDASKILAARAVGIDVSNNNGAINWTSVANAGIDFAWAKATEGTSFTDSYFNGSSGHNMNNGTAAGVLMGAYHFARPDLNSDATTEAAHFVAVASPYLTDGYLRPVLDVETGFGLSTTALSNWINTFCSYVTSHAGADADPLIYMSSSPAGSEVNSSVTTHPLWVANYPSSATDPPVPTGNPPAGTGVWSDWAFWQYSSKGTSATVPGISSTYVDLDVAHGDINFVRSFLIGGTGLPEQFDVNGTASGSGVVNNGSYTWEAAGFSSSSAGTDPVSWADGNFLRLAAGTDAGAKNYTITANSNHVVGGMMLQTNGGGTVTINGSGVLSIASGDQGFYVSNSSQNLKINASLGGSGRLVWQGDGSGAGGSLYLLGNNTYSGGTLLNTSAGLNFNNDNSFGTGRITWGVSQQVLADDIASAPITLPNPVTTLAGGQLIYVGPAAAPVTFTGAWTLPSGSSELTIGNASHTSSKMTIGGNIGGSGGALVKDGVGTLVLSGSNSYTGSTTISAGTLQIGNGGTTGKLSTSSSITNNGSLVFNRTNTVTQGTDFSGGAISGTGSLTQAGSGTLILNAANTYGGKTYLNSGTVSISSDGNLGAGPGSTITDQLTFNGGALRITADMSLNSKRGITINSSGGTFSIDPGKTLTGAPAITNSAGLLTITGGGTYETGSTGQATTFTGAAKWRVTGGSILATTSNNVQTGANPASPVADFFTLDNGTYQSNTGGVAHTINANKGITLGSGGGTIDTSTATTTYGGVITGGGDFIKRGANDLNLTGANTYTGMTTISSGALILSGTTATLGSGNVTVSGTTAGTLLMIQSDVANALSDTATLSLLGGGTSGVADQGYANLASGVDETIGALLLGGVAQVHGLTYGSTASGAAVQSNEYFAGVGFVSVGLPGDFNDDGSVDAGDYLTWRKNESTFGGNAGYDLWRADFGMTAPSGSGSSTSLSAQTAVPEPGAMMLALIGFVATKVVRGRRSLILSAILA